jgi:hypothetical protein
MPSLMRERFDSPLMDAESSSAPQGERLLLWAAIQLDDSPHFVHPVGFHLSEAAACVHLD